MTLRLARLFLVLLGIALCFGFTAAGARSAEESRLVRRADGTYAAIPESQRRAKIFRLVAREASWTLRPGLTTMAKTYNGVVPGPTLVVDQGDRVVIDFTNELDVPDTVHLHGIHGAPAEMDGVAGISQPLVQPHHHFRYEFTASDDGTFIYHSHGSEAMVDAGLYGGIIVRPAHPRAVERGVKEDYLEVVSAWALGGGVEDHFTINGKEYPATQPIEVDRSERVRIRWINISSENDHTMHTHGHYQHVIARDARPAPEGDVEDTVLMGPGQRVDVIVTADAKPGTWILHCHFLDHTQDMHGMPQGLVTAIHYRGTPNKLAAMGDAMREGMPDSVAMSMPSQSEAPLGVSKRVLLIAGVSVVIGVGIGWVLARLRRSRVSD